MQLEPILYLVRVSSRNFILGGKLTDHVAVRPRRGEGRLHNYNILGGKLGQFGGEVELFGGEASPALPPLDETLLVIQPTAPVIILIGGSQYITVTQLLSSVLYCSQ